MIIVFRPYYACERFVPYDEIFSGYENSVTDFVLSPRLELKQGVLLPQYYFRKVRVDGHDSSLYEVGQSALTDYLISPDFDHSALNGGILFKCTSFGGNESSELALTLMRHQQTYVDLVLGYLSRLGKPALLINIVNASDDRDLSEVGQSSPLVVSVSHSSQEVEQIKKSVAEFAGGFRSKSL